MRRLDSGCGRSGRNRTGWWPGLAGFAVWMLMACAPSVTLLPDRAALPPDLVQPCPSLPPLIDGTAGAVLRWALDTIEQYGECARGKQALIDAVQPTPP